MANREYNKTDDMLSGMPDFQKESLLEGYEHSADYGEGLRPEERELYERLLEEREKMEQIKDNAGKELVSGFLKISETVKKEIAEYNMVHGVWLGRIANNDRPQDYVEIGILKRHIKDSKERDEVHFTLSFVKNNTERQVKDFEGNAATAFESALQEFRDTLLQAGRKEVESMSRMKQLDMEKGVHSTLYGTGTLSKLGSTLEEHYQKMEEHGYKGPRTTLSESYEEKYKNFKPTAADKKIYEMLTGKELPSNPQKARTELELTAEKCEKNHEYYEDYEEMREAIFSTNPEIKALSEQENMEQEKAEKPRNRMMAMQGHTR